MPALLNASDSEIDRWTTIESIIIEADKIGIVLPPTWNPDLPEGRDLFLSAAKTACAAQARAKATAAQGREPLQFSDGGSNPDLPVAGGEHVPQILAQLKRLGVSLPGGWSFTYPGASELLLVALENAAAKKEAERSRAAGGDGDEPNSADDTEEEAERVANRVFQRTNR